VLDLYGHFLPSDYSGFANALGEANLGSPKPLAAPQALLTESAVQRGARTRKPQNTALLAGSPGRTRTCDPSVNRGRGARGMTRSYTTARFTARIQAHTVFPETAPRPQVAPHVHWQTRRFDLLTSALVFGRNGPQPSRALAGTAR